MTTNKDLLNEKEKLETNINKPPIKKVNKIINPQNKTTFQNNKRNRIQINTREDAFIERKSYNLLNFFINFLESE